MKIPLHHLVQSLSPSAIEICDRFQYLEHIYLSIKSRGRGKVIRTVSLRPREPSSNPTAE